MITIIQRGRKYRFLFTINAWFVCCEELELDFFNLLEKDESNKHTDDEMTKNLVYGAYINACLVGHYNIKSKSKIFRFIDRLKVADYKKLVEAMMSSKINGRTVGEILKENPVGKT